MIGIFDSGAGGLMALKELRRLSPSEDILFLADRQNAPYGTKSEEDIIRLAEKNIEKLHLAGAERVLIACCTASTVYHRFSPEIQRISVPIIAPTARKAAELTKNRNIAVIATNHTVKSKAFSESIKKIDERIRVSEFKAQELVGLAERVSLGKKPSCEELLRIKELLFDIESLGADTLILGCTHFSVIKNEIQSIVKNIKLADAAKTGAELIAEHRGYGLGATVFL